MPSSRRTAGAVGVGDKQHRGGGVLPAAGGGGRLPASGSAASTGRGPLCRAARSLARAARLRRRPPPPLLVWTARSHPRAARSEAAQAAPPAARSRRPPRRRLLLPLLRLPSHLLLVRDQLLLVVRHPREGIWRARKARRRLRTSAHGGDALDNILVMKAPRALLRPHAARHLHGICGSCSDCCFLAILTRCRRENWSLSK